VTHPTTSGSGPANAIQLADGSGVFVVKEIPLFGFVHGGGIPEGNLQTCVLSEPSIPESPITVDRHPHVGRVKSAAEGL
jgi:hypothetical protein